jgi:pimeloyl-ACP methyl ester carboxylesterase
MNIVWSRRRSRAWLLLTAIVIAPLAQAAVGNAGAHEPGEVVIESRTLKTAGGELVRYEIGTLFVPENRAAKHSRTIGVGFMRFRASQPTNAPPSFHLPGGPGGSYLNAYPEDGESPAEGIAARLVALQLSYRAIGDVVLVDQRGFSRRGEMLTYAYHPTALPLDQPFSQPSEIAADMEMAKRAVAAHTDKDLAGYTVIQCAGDVNDLRRALGYAKINLVGQSFGSQWSFAVMRLHPQIVERAMLSGVEPLDNGYDMPSHIYSAISRLAHAAEQEPALKPYLPQGGLMGAVRTIRERLTHQPVIASVKNDATGETASVTLGVEDFQRALLWRADEWPAFILSIYYGHYEKWAAAEIDERVASDEQAPLIGPLIDTSLGVSAAREHALRTDAGVDLLGAWNFASGIATAPIWPTPDVGDDLRLPARSAIPVVFIHGDLDSSTPVENTLSMLPYFPNSRAILVHNAGHSANVLLLEQRPAIKQALLQFLATGDMRALPVNVTVDLPRFAPPSFAPPPSTGS